MYATQVKAKWSKLKKIIDIDDRFLDKEAQVIILFPDGEDKDWTQFTEKNKKARKKALQEQKKWDIVSLDQLKKKYWYDI